MIKSIPKSTLQRVYAAGENFLRKFNKNKNYFEDKDKHDDANAEH